MRRMNDKQIDFNNKPKIFGPVPSRRLGRSLGINHIPPKVCTYSCVYCQLGRTQELTVQRRPFFPPEVLNRKVLRKIGRIEHAGESIDYLTFIADGEPTLDIHLGPAIDLARRMNIPVAVITNGSLLWRNDARTHLMNADWISVKIDTVSEDVWHKINRPHGVLRLKQVLDGIQLFSEEYQGDLVTESMICKGLNDDIDGINRVADYIARLNRIKSYIALPIRPPTEKWVQPPHKEKAMNAYQLFKDRIENMEYLFGNEENHFTSTDDVTEDLLGITSVHPMREEAVRNLIEKAGRDWSMIDRLLSENILVETEYQGEKFFIKNIWDSKS